MKKPIPARRGHSRAISIQTLEIESTHPEEICQWPAPAPGQAGAACPRCQQGVLDYDGMLNLICPKCDYMEGGCFT